MTTDRAAGHHPFEGLRRLAAAPAGALVLRGGFAAARAAGLTRLDLAARLAPGRPLRGAVLQLALASAALSPVPALRLGPVAGAAWGAGLGAAAIVLMPDDDRRRRGTPAVSLLLHAAAGATAGALARRA